MQRLVDDLLTLSALESEHDRGADASFAMLPLLLECPPMPRRSRARRHKIALDVAEPAIVTGNRDELASAFGNLVSNAIRYTPTAAQSRSPGGSTTRAAAHSASPTRASASPRAHPPADRAVLSRRPKRARRDGRHRSRARDRQARAAAASGGARRHERAGIGQHVHGAAAGAARGAQNRRRSGAGRESFDYQ